MAKAKQAAVKMETRRKTTKAKVVVEEPPKPEIQYEEMVDPLMVVAKPVKVPLTVDAAVASGNYKVHIDSHSRTCLEVERTLRVKFIELDITEGLHVKDLRVDSFELRYKPLNYPVVKACVAYLGFASRYGATDEVLRFLSVVTPSAALADKARQVMHEKKGPKMSDETKAKLKEKAAKAKAEKGPKAPRKSAAEMFKKLILEGKLTDDQIFANVKAEFGLDDKKRSYVAWYRNSLKKSGVVVPEPKVSKEELAAAKEKEKAKEAAAKEKEKAKAAKLKEKEAKAKEKAKAKEAAAKEKAKAAASAAASAS